MFRKLVAFSILTIFSSACGYSQASSSAQNTRLDPNAIIPKYQSFDPEDGEDYHEVFWQYNKDFGFIRDKKSVLLIMKNGKSPKEIVRDLLNWKEIVGENIPHRAPKKVRSPISDSDAYNVTELLPNHIAEISNREIEDDGPNCWNSALFSARVTKGIHKTLAEEITHWLRSDLATEILSARDLKPGDLIVYRSKEKIEDTYEVHAGVYISDKLVFSKNSLLWQEQPKVC